MQVPSMGKPDLLFLARRYIDQTLPNYIQYEKLLDDMNFIIKSFISEVQFKTTTTLPQKTFAGAPNVLSAGLYN